MFRKITSLIVCMSFIFTQPVFSQVAQLNLAGYLGQGQAIVSADRFRPLHMRYFSYDNIADKFELLLDKGDNQDIKDAELQEKAKVLMDYFLIGLSLPNEKFWVNLRPDAEDQIIDPELENTDVGKIMLEADLQLKKDTASFTSPQALEGREYWDKLYKKAGELFGNENITIPTITRPWIVPGEVIIRESQDSGSTSSLDKFGTSLTTGAYIYKANLKVMLEQDHLKNSTTYNFSDPRMKELNEYSSQLIRELIIPKLTKEVNSSKRYAQLRQVFFSLVLSRWFKDTYKGKPGTYASLIDTHNLANLTSQESWSKTYYFKEYKKSFEQGEYNLKEQIATPYGQVIRSYVSGGFDLTGTSSPMIIDRFKGNMIRTFLLVGATFFIPMKYDIKNKVWIKNPTEAEAQFDLDFSNPMNLLNPLNPMSPFNIYDDDPNDEYFTREMKKTLKNILSEDENVARKAYAHLKEMPFSNSGAQNMINMILSAINRPGIEVTPELYDALSFFVKSSRYDFNSDFYYTIVDNLFTHIDAKYNGMNFKFFPLTFTFYKPGNELLPIYALNALTDSLKIFRKWNKEKVNEWYKHALGYFRGYSHNNKDRVDRNKTTSDPTYAAIVELAKVTSKLGSSPITQTKNVSASPLSPKQTINDIQFKPGQHVFERCEFNVSFEKDDTGTRVITDDLRIRASLSTIRKLLASGVKLIIAAHLGRPQERIKEEVDKISERNKEIGISMAEAEILAQAKKVVSEELSLDIVAQRLREYLPQVSVHFDKGFFTPKDAQSFIKNQMKNGEILLLENVRMNEWEEKKGEGASEFAKDLFFGIDVFVQDAFGGTHRKHISIIGAPQGIPKVAGDLVAKETEYLGQVLEDLDVAIIGGSKVSEKIGIIEELLKKTRKILIGGAMSFAFLRAQGLSTGSSKVGKTPQAAQEEIAIASMLLEKVKKEYPGEEKLVLPLDHVLGDTFDKEPSMAVTLGAEIPDGFMGLDIGPKTAQMYSTIIEGAKKVFWNGPVGVFEYDNFDKGSREIAQAMIRVKEKGGLAVAGGGDTGAALEKFGWSDKVSYVCTGGGAATEFIEKNGALPGIVVLDDKVNGSSPVNQEAVDKVANLLRGIVPHGSRNGLDERDLKLLKALYENYFFHFDYTIEQGKEFIVIDAIKRLNKDLSDIKTKINNSEVTRYLDSLAKALEDIVPSSTRTSDKVAVDQETSSPVMLQDSQKKLEEYKVAMKDFLKEYIEPASLKQISQKDKDEIRWYIDFYLSLKNEMNIAVCAGYISSVAEKYLKDIDLAGQWEAKQKEIAEIVNVFSAQPQPKSASPITLEEAQERFHAIAGDYKASIGFFIKKVNDEARKSAHEMIIATLAPYDKFIETWKAKYQESVKTLSWLGIILIDMRSEIENDIQDVNEQIEYTQGLNKEKALEVLQGCKTAMERLALELEGLEQDISATLYPKEDQDEASSGIREEEKVVGGIDFRAISYMAQPMGSFQGLDFRLVPLSKAELDAINIKEELADIQRLVKGRFDPSADRLKRVLAAMYQKGEFKQETQSELVSLIIDICRFKEEECLDTSADFRAILLIADTGLYVKEDSQQYALN